MKKIKMLKELFQLTEHYRIQYFLSFFLVFISSVMRVLSPFIVLKVFDNAITEMQIERLFSYSSLFILTTIIGSASEILYQYIISRFNRKMVLKLRKKCYEHINNLSGNYMSNYNSGDLFTTLYRDIEEIPSVLTTSLFNFISNLITVIGLIYFLVSLQFDLLIILISFQILLYFIQRYYNKKFKKTTENTRIAIGALNSSAQEMIANLFAFTEGALKRYFKKKHYDLENEYASKLINGSFILTLNNSILSLINSITVATILCYGGYKVILGSLTYGGLVTFNLYSQRFMGPILQLVQFNNSLTSCSISWSRLNNLLDIKTTVINGTRIEKLKGHIIFDNVSFLYEDKKSILHNISMEFKTGRTYAIVGPSGAGKTTLMHLLFRLWDCNEGKITVDNINIKDLDIDCLRSQISIVSQNIFLLNDSIYNNIVLENGVSTNELYDILVQADIYDFINSLPQKLDTIVGENGIKLSGGEKQRISIARALLRKSPILIFDEATSMLDNETEDKIISILLESFKDITVILIAHRLSTVKNASLIYVLDNGTFIECGTHDELLKMGGFYYNLYNI